MKIKKHIALFFTCYYLIISVGLTLTLHFCGGSLAGVSTFSSEIACESISIVNSCCAEKKSEKGCCNTEVIDFDEVQEDAVLQSLDSIIFFVAVIQDIQTFFFHEARFKNKIALPNYTFQSNAPPLYKLYGTYIHYA